MIRVELQPEPESFDEKVRQPGLRAIREMTGQRSDRSAGRPHSKIAERPEDIPSSKLPAYWRECLPDLLDAYRRICAYVAMYIERVTGDGSVDHLVAKSREIDATYEWSNYRLACRRMNARKGAIPDVLDPCTIEEGWFQIELAAYQVVPAPDLDQERRDRVQKTIDRLGLSDVDCRELRREYHQAYQEGDISFDWLARRSPFLARELERQGWT